MTTSKTFTKTYDNWLRDQELAEAFATNPAERTDWQRKIVAHHANQLLGGIQIVSLEDPAELHNTIKNAINDYDAENAEWRRALDGSCRAKE